MSHQVTDLPNVDPSQFKVPAIGDFSKIGASTHRPRFLLLYGSVRERSYSRLLTMEAARLLEAMGGEVKIFDPRGLPLPDSEPETHPKVVELRELANWSEGMVWCSPERHGAMTGIMKAQIDWIPLTQGAIRPSQGKTLAVMEVSGGSQSFNAVNQMRILGRWMRMLTIASGTVYLECGDVGEVAMHRVEKFAIATQCQERGIHQVLDQLHQFQIAVGDVNLVHADTVAACVALPCRAGTHISKHCITS